MKNQPTDLDYRTWSLDVWLPEDIEELLRSRDQRAAEIEKLRAELAEYRNATTWGVTCTNCARTLDAAYEQTMRAEKAEAEKTNHGPGCTAQFALAQAAEITRLRAELAVEQKISFDRASERDAALAEIERLRGELAEAANYRDNCMARAEAELTTERELSGYRSGKAHKAEAAIARVRALCMSWTGIESSSSTEYDRLQQILAVLESR